MTFDFLNLFKKKTLTKKPFVLVILDGFGIAPPSEGNAISLAKTPYLNSLYAKYINSQLIASGEAVGLSANDKGNTEVGHLTIGAGRVILQDLKRISEDIKGGRFFYNPAFLKVSDHVKKNNSKLHIVGLIGKGVTHASNEHLMALIKFCKSEGITKLFLHLFTDGRDSPPREAVNLVAQLESDLTILGVGKIATIGGRYFGMDRDNRWERTELAYKAMVTGVGKKVKSARELFDLAKDSVLSDEFIEPTVITDDSGNPLATIDDGDGLIFYNFRTDRPKQLTIALCEPNFENMKSFDFGYDPETRRDKGEVKIDKTFDRQKIVKDLFLVTMTEYQKGLPVSAVAYPPEAVINPLGVVLQENKKSQIRIAESEKEKFITYYFNGLREKPLENETDLIVPSQKVKTYDLKPEMSLPKITKEVKNAINSDKYDFLAINIANPDMVAHSGNLTATIKAIEYVDLYLQEMVKEVLFYDGVAFITADHGNAEELISYSAASFFITSNKGAVDTDHSNYPVPFIVVGTGFEKGKIEIKNGSLSDIAPTILQVMGIKPPSEMSGMPLVG